MPLPDFEPVVNENHRLVVEDLSKFGTLPERRRGILKTNILRHGGIVCDAPPDPEPVVKENHRGRWLRRTTGRREARRGRWQWRRPGGGGGGGWQAKGPGGVRGGGGQRRRMRRHSRGGGSLMPRPPRLRPEDRCGGRWRWRRPGGGGGGAWQRGQRCQGAKGRKAEAVAVAETRRRRWRRKSWLRYNDVQVTPVKPRPAGTKEGNPQILQLRRGVV